MHGASNYKMGEIKTEHGIFTRRRSLPTCSSPISAGSDSIATTNATALDGKDTSVFVTGNFGTDIINKSANLNVFKRRTFTGEEVMCTICGRVLCNKYVLKVHERDVHMPRKMHHCNFCGRPYSTINSLRVHISTSHPCSREPLKQ